MGILYKKSILLLKNVLPTVNGFLIGVLTLFLLNPNFAIFHKKIPSHLFLLGSCTLAVILLFGLLKTKFKIEPFGAFLSLILLLLSNTLNAPYNLLQGPIIKGEIILFSFFVFLFFKKINIISFLLFLSPLFLFLIFSYESSGGLVWSDDNPTFLYRLELLKKFFPNIPFFYTGWNAGLDARDFFATGAINVFLLSYPLIVFLDLSKHFNLILSYILFLLLPIFTIISCKILKKDWKFISIATSLSLTTNLFWYRWALKYGTLGFITSTCLIPLVFTLTQKFLSKEENLSTNEAWALILLTSLMLLWTPTGLVFIPCFIYALIFLPRILKKTHLKKIILGLLIINLPWICVFWSASNVGNFLTIEKPSISTVSKDKKIPPHEVATGFKTTTQKKINLEKSLKNLRETFIPMNPLLLLFPLSGLIFLPRSYKNLFLLTAIWLIFLGTTVSQLKPQMEFDRMLIILGVLSATPTTAGIYHFFSKDSLKNKIAISITLGIIFSSIFATGSMLKNRTLEIYYRQNNSVKNLISFLRDYPASGRILFSGFVLHQFGEGHIAPLPILTKKQIIASTPFHNVWKYTQVFPKEFMKYDKIKDYLSLMNVELVIAHEKFWRDYFLKDQDFIEIFKYDNYKIFKYKKFIDSYVITGKVKNLKVSENKISFTPLTNSVVLKFNFFPFLTTNNCKITKEQVSDSLNFIKLSNCKIEEYTTIKSKNALLRIFNNGK